MKRPQHGGRLDAHVLAGATIGDFRYGYTQFNMSLLPTTLTNPLWKTYSRTQTDDPYQPSAPIVGTTGYAGLGNARSTPLIRDQNMHEVDRQHLVAEESPQPQVRRRFAPPHHRRDGQPSR